ncbi:discoidin domain-containing protein [Geobacter sp. DSM 9736]|uniref:discoidin domain-containing protein n=1 Tax=Geobacter sp. DSM 9736 TaxID=1277350 RepID=UPI000B4FEAC7|nr:discoidin domain-containing protein [Geobacter sp. DSM 9736]SNB46128.1 F5/8 type C domain-containing protein [Geobacter sp. DSM 9736]
MSDVQISTVRNKQTRRFVSLALLSVLLLNSVLQYPEAHGAQTTLTWDHPANPDGTPAANVGGYKVYQGSIPGRYSQNIDIGNQSTFTVDLAEGTTYLAVTAYDAAGNESPYSNEVSRTVSPGSTGSAPGISKTGWRLLYADSQELSGDPGAAINAFDGKTDTFWHTQWMNGNPAPPHEIQIDLGQSYNLTGFSYLPRQNSIENGRIARYEFYVTDGADWSTPVATGNFSNDLSLKMVSFPAKTGRYIRLRALSEVNGNPWTNAAEISVTGTPGTGTVTSYTLTATAGIGGSISAVGNTAISQGTNQTSTITSVSVNQGSSQTFSITPDTGYRISDVKVDGVSVGAVSSYTFNSVNAGHSIAATFSQVSSPAVPQTNWRLVYADSQELVGDPGAALNAFDGKNDTFWHTQWMNGNPVPPHEIQIDLGQTYNLDGFSYLPRQNNIQNGRIAKYEFYVSSNGTNWGTAVAAGTFANDLTLKSIGFPATTGRYIRLRALSEVNGNPWTNAAEINVTGTPAAAGIQSYALTASAGTGGSITPAGTTTVAGGSSRTYTITPSAGYKVADVKVDGISVGAVTSYSFSNVTKDHSIAASFSATSGRVVFATNCGGRQFTDSNGVVYQADTRFTGGATNSTATAISGTVDDPLYQSWRYGNATYNVPVSNGDYMVTLKFADYHTSAGKRLFNVAMEGITAISSLDIYGKAGSSYKAYDVTIPVTVKDGVLTIRFTNLVDQAKVNAIVVSTK